ncbi:MAG: hypothetical protein R3D60_09375 [Paracoccaceae bacterium]
MPTWLFRGFTNTGPDDGWLFTCLGGDNTGDVIFHREIIREAAQYGLYFSRDNMLIDTSRGDPVPAPEETIAPMSDAQVARLRVMPREKMLQRVVTRESRGFRPGFIDADLPGCGAELAPVIGAGLTQNRDHVAPITNPHGFSIEWLRMAPGTQVSPFSLDDKMVLILREGALRLVLNDEGDVTIDLKPWDTYSIPAGVTRRIEAARERGSALDAGGFVAPVEVLPNYAMAGE